MNTPTTHIALITGDTLQMIGLKTLIKQQNEQAVVELFGSLGEFRDSDLETFDILYVEDGVIALGGDFFRGKRFCVIPIITTLSPEQALLGLGGDQLVIHPRWDCETLKRAIRESFRTSHVIKESTAEKGLSSREEEVLKEVARGLTNKEIADALNISMNTVMTHRKNITSKLNIKTVSGLTFYALMNNLISGEEVVERASD